MSQQTEEGLTKSCFSRKFQIVGMVHNILRNFKNFYRGLMNI